MRRLTNSTREDVNLALGGVEELTHREQTGKVRPVCLLLDKMAIFRNILNRAEKEVTEESRGADGL